MHCRGLAAEIARKLSAPGHTNSLTGPTWRPGHRVTQASPKTARLWHDGTASVRWVGERPSTVHWDRLADAEHVHGHGGHTVIVWDD